MKLLLLPILFLLSSCYTGFTVRPAATVGEIPVEIVYTFDGHEPHWDHHDRYCCVHYGHYDRTYTSYYWHQRYYPRYRYYKPFYKSSVKRQKRPNLKMIQERPVRKKQNVKRKSKNEIQRKKTTPS